MTIKSVGVMSVARIAAVFFSLAAVAGMGLSEEVGSQVGWMGPMFGFGAILALPVLYFVLGFLGGAIGAWVFNHAARAMGGLEIELEEAG